MTTLHEPLRTAEPDLSRPAPSAPAPPPPVRLDVHRPGVRLVAQVLAVLAAVALCFVAQITVFGALKHDRDQAARYDEFRAELANATAPVSPLGPDKRPLPAGTPVAIMEIPRIGLREVIGEGTSSGALNSGPGHQRDTVLPGQAGVSVIMGRRAAYGGPFGLIGKLRPNDEIELVTGQGEHRYVVIGARQAGDPLPPPPRPDEGRLLLDTADGPRFLPTDVLRVDARLLTKPQPTNGALPPFVVPESERVLVGDAGALTGVVLWTALLVAGAIGVVYVRQRAGRWQAWIIGIPLLGVLGVTVADHVASLFPNLM